MRCYRSVIDVEFYLNVINGRLREKYRSIFFLAKGWPKVIPDKISISVNDLRSMLNYQWLQKKQSLFILQISWNNAPPLPKETFSFLVSLMVSDLTGKERPQWRKQVFGFLRRLRRGGWYLRMTRVKTVASGVVMLAEETSFLFI